MSGNFSLHSRMAPFVKQVHTLRGTFLIRGHCVDQLLLFMGTLWDIFLIRAALVSIFCQGAHCGHIYKYEHREGAQYGTYYYSGGPISETVISGAQCVNVLTKMRNRMVRLRV